jgi:hypothetical protein
MNLVLLEGTVLDDPTEATARKHFLRFHLLCHLATPEQEYIFPITMWSGHAIEMAVHRGDQVLVVGCLEVDRATIQVRAMTLRRIVTFMPERLAVSDTPEPAADADIPF